MEAFPPNSRKARDADRGPKRVERVASGTVRRKPLGKQFKQTFFSGDARTAVGYMFDHVVVPSAQEMFLEAMNSVFERMVYGNGRPGRRAPTANPLGRFNYNQVTSRPPTPPTQMLGRSSRMRHAFDDIEIHTREEAEEVLDRMFDLISRYDSVSVADLYELTGIQSSHTDQKWGWHDLSRSSVGRVRGGGYLLQLPEPVPLG